MRTSDTLATLSSLGPLRALGLALLAAGCFQDGTRWVGTSPPLTPQVVCTEGSQRCALGKIQACKPGSTGSADWVDGEDCSSQGMVCASSLLKCTACVPGEASCNGQQAMLCRSDGTGADLVATCDTTMGNACRGGTCQELCEVATTERSNIGCEYWGADLDNAMIDATENAAAQQYAIVVSNGQPDVPVHARVFQDDSSPGEPNAPYLIADAIIAPYNLQVFDLGPREVDGSPPGQFNTGTGTALTRHAYKVVTDFPVSAFQFNPLDNVDVFSNDASLLKPADALAPDGHYMQPMYVVAGWPQTIAITDDPATNFDPEDPVQLRAFLAIIATQPDTHVRVTTNAAVVAGGPVPATPIGGVIEATLGPFDVLNLETGDFNADFTGSLIETDSAVVVFSGSEASDAPHFTTLADRRCCADHLENQLDPLRTAGKLFAIAHNPSRTAAVKAAGGDIGVNPEPDFVRFIAASERGATIKTSLAAPNDTIVLSFRGDFVEVTAYGDFTVKSSDPIHVSQVMPSQDAAGDPRGLPGGDPSLVVYPPIAQFRPNYVFLTPDKYVFDFVAIVAPPSANVYLDSTLPKDLGCETVPADGLTAAERGSPEPPYVVYRCQLSFPVIDVTTKAAHRVAGHAERRRAPGRRGPAGRRYRFRVRLVRELRVPGGDRSEGDQPVQLNAREGAPGSHERVRACAELLCGDGLLERSEPLVGSLGERPEILGDRRDRLKRDRRQLLGPCDPIRSPCDPIRASRVVRLHLLGQVDQHALERSAADRDVARLSLLLFRGGHGFSHLRTEWREQQGAGRPRRACFDVLGGCSRRRARGGLGPAVTGPRTCLRIFFTKVCVHLPWVSSWSMISRVSRAFTSFERPAQSRTSPASWPPSNVEGQVCFSAATGLFGCR